MRSARRNRLLRACALAILGCLLLAGGQPRAASEPPAASERAGSASEVAVPGRSNPAANARVSFAPTVLKVEPSQVVAGQSYTLALTGTAFRPTMQLDFGSGIVIQKPVTVADGSHARVSVQVAAGTPSGRHLVTTTFAPAATLSAVPALKSEGPGYVDVVAAKTNGPVVLELITPRQVPQGQSAMLTLQGSGFSAGMSVSFGPGIAAAGAVQVQSPERATLTIQVAPQAPPMLRHPALLLAGHDVRVSPEATLTVTAVSAVVPPTPAPTVAASVPVVLAISPARVFTGQSYTLTLRGLNLVPQLQVDLGAGIVPSGGLRVQSPSLATLQVQVQDTAPSGMHWVGLQLPAALTPVREDASVLVQHSVSVPRQGFAPQPGECKPAVVTHHGTIALDGPLYTGYSSDGGGTYNIPVLNDQTNFTWHEANAGLAERYEVRFYSGKTMVASRSLTSAPGYALPHNLGADAGLIAELARGVAGRATKVVNQHPTPGANPPALGWDLTWQVVGLRTFYASCISASAISGASAHGLISQKTLGPGKELEVEHSESVPITQATNGDPLLDLPAAPTGLACNAPPGSSTLLPLRPRSRGAGGGSAAGGSSPATSSLLLSNATLASQANGRTATAAGYIGDHWQFSGRFDLSGAPWALESQQSVSTAHAQYPVETEALNNVFVDWGDGTIEPLTVQWHGQYCGSQPCFASNTETSNAEAFDLDQATNPGAFGHSYGEVGSFDVRVYMLPASAVQQQGALPASLKAGAGGLYGKLLARSGQMPAGGQSSGDLAYMLLCQTVNIQHRTDPVANGPLKLVGIHVTGFPDAASSGAAAVGPAKLRPGSALGSGITSGKSATAGSSKALEPPRIGAPPPGAGAADKLLPLKIRPGGAGAGPQVPQFSSCDSTLIAGAGIDFLGQGTVKLTWYQDGKPVGTAEEPLGPSRSRTDAELAPKSLSVPIVTTWSGFHSPALTLAQEQIGQHDLQVTAEVVQDTHPTRRAVDALGQFAAPASQTGSGIHGAALAGAPPLGLLGPRGAAAAGLPPIVWVGQAPASAVGASLHLTINERPPLGTPSLTGNPPNEVASAPSAYQLTAADPSLPCTFSFPVNGGKFVVSGLQHGGKATVQQQGGSYSGSGTLQAEFADASGTSTQPEPVPIHLNGWKMQPDGVTVASGSFDDRPSSSPMHVPGLTASLERIAGTAGEHVTATLTASLANTDIPAASGRVPPPWKDVSSTLSPQGDWYAANLPTPVLLVYDSGFSVRASSVTLDLSQSDGQGADSSCQGGSGKSWMGVLLNQATLTAFDFNLANPPTAPATAWGLDSYGFCGQVHFPSGSFAVDRGRLSWSDIAATASRGRFSASYDGLKVHVPWLDADLTSPQATTQLTAGQGAGQGGINLNLNTPSKVTVTEGPVTLTASNLSFASVPAAGGWAVKSDTTLSFNAPQGQFAGGIVLHGFNYGMNGSGSFSDGSSTRHISLAGQKGAIGGALVDLKSVDVQVGAPSSTTRLAFAFDSTLTLSKTLPAADVSVSYNIAEPSSGAYQGTGPVTAPFKLDKPFPDANPSVHLSMTPTYVGGSSPKTKSGILFSSNLDLGMFGGPPVAGQFVLGYVGSDDYWLARALLDLGPTGVAVVPPAINLYQVGGGMGYNVSLDSFKYTDLRQATPKVDGTLLFDASLLVGSPDHTTFGLTGDFVIKPGGQDPGGRMDYHAWLLDSSWSGQSPIYGYFSYSGGIFDGTLNAQWSLLNNQVGMQALHDAIHMHVGGGLWYFHFGTQSNPLDGHVFMFDGKAWADLGSDGFDLGLMSRLDVDAGDCNGACAYIHDDWTLTAGITPSPLAFSASANDSFGLGACAAGFCLNANASAAVSLSLPPPYLNFGFGLGGCPPGQINVGLQVLPSLNPSVGGNVCL